MKLYRVVYDNGDSDGLSFFYAPDEEDARKQFNEMSTRPILSITLMPGGFTSGGYSSGDRIHLPAAPSEEQEKK
ncbi:MAG TPA: hypothetical protein VFN23_07785 [Ktedonobacteraceae bacterium]|nr:hypothetical protein [Ktedonobacteraceae bacterium]